MINASPGDLTPVFDAMLEKAIACARRPFGVTCAIYDGECFHASGDAWRTAEFRLPQLS